MLIIALICVFWITYVIGRGFLAYEIGALVFALACTFLFYYFT